MDLSEFLFPVSFELRTAVYAPFSVGNRLKFDLNEPPDENSIILITTDELYPEESWDEADFDDLRRHFYNLSQSNWNRDFYDLGHLPRGATFEDSCFALHQVANRVAQTGATLIVLGGTQSFSYILYQSWQKDLMKVGTIDLKPDISAESEELTADNHITRMILDETHRLLEYKNIGSQIPYVAKEELDILEQLNFEDLRLGRLIRDFHLAEPMMRELDLLSVDMIVMQRTSFKSALFSTPNGLNEREICGLMNYAGLSSSLKMLHISGFVNPNDSDNNLIAEMLWYFTEAANNQKSDDDLETYRVQSDDGEIVFLHSRNSDRWWIQAETEGKFSCIPCSESDYTESLKGEVPEKWLKFYKKFY